jgi:hypothetical protein
MYSTKLHLSNVYTFCHSREFILYTNKLSSREGANYLSREKEIYILN